MGLLTALRKFRYPVSTDAFNPPLHFQQLAQDVDAWTGEQVVALVTDSAHRDSLYPSPRQGLMVSREDTGRTEKYFEALSPSNPGGADIPDWYPVDARQVPDPSRLQLTALPLNLLGTNAWTEMLWAGLSVDLPQDTWCEVEFQGWIGVTGASNDARVDVVVSGATTIAAGSHGWGQTAYGNVGTTKSNARKVVKLNAGTNLVKLYGYRFVSSTGTFQITQGTVSVIPLRRA